MTARWRGVRIVAFGVWVALTGCATQQATSQAMTIGGAAAVVLGASMAADEQCYAAGPGEGGVQSYCSPGLGPGARTAAKGLAVAGVGLAAAGYALKPKGPDRLQRVPGDPDLAPASPYRLIRPEPAPEGASESPPSEEASAAPQQTVSAPPEAPCRPNGSGGSTTGGAAEGCAAPPAPAPPGETPAPPDGAPAPVVGPRPSP